MKPIPKPKTYEEFKNPSIALQKQLIARILLASDRINQNGRVYPAASFLVLGQQAHDQIMESMNVLERVELDHPDTSLTIFRDPNGEYIAGVDPALNEDDIGVRRSY